VEGQRNKLKLNYGHVQVLENLLSPNAIYMSDEETTESHVRIIDDYVDSELCMWSYRAIWSSYILLCQC
jgi:hypothetical protein